MSAAKRDTLISARENRRMFDRLARKYDIATRAISWGLDRGWRRKAVEVLRPFRGGRYLDVGTGTGALVFEMLKQSGNVLIDGVDAVEQMLEIARVKAERRGVGDAVNFFVADALELPMESNIYDGVICGFSFRNLERRQRALEEMYRVLKPGGMLVVLEATCPEKAWVHWSYCHYMRIIPLIGKWMGAGTSYQYLVDSIADFPTTGTVTDMFSATGFSGVRYMPLAFGAVCIFSGKK